MTMDDWTTEPLAADESSRQRLPDDQQQQATDYAMAECASAYTGPTTDMG